MPTPHIEVSITTEYLPRQSDPDQKQYAFAYHISINNRGDETAQLISRHWIITDANESREEVQGLGVIGEQPFIAPGECYQYTSGVILKTQIGTMAGSYQMLSASDVSFDASIPTFLLATPNAVH